MDYSLVIQSLECDLVGIKKALSEYSPPIPKYEKEYKLLEKMEGQFESAIKKLKDEG